MLIACLYIGDCYICIAMFMFDLILNADSPGDTFFNTRIYLKQMDLHSTDLVRPTIKMVADGALLMDEI